MNRWMIIPIGIIVIAGLFYAFTSATITGYVIYEPYTETVPLREEVPVEVEQSVVQNETETRTECSETNAGYKIDIWNGTYLCTEETPGPIGTLCVKKKASCFVVLANTAKEKADFTVGMYFVIKGERTDATDKTKTIKAYGSEEYRWESPEVAVMDEVFCDYIIRELPKIKTCSNVTEPKITTLTKKINVTKVLEKNITVTKNITIERNKTVNRIFGYEQGFYLGY